MHAEVTNGTLVLEDLFSERKWVAEESYESGSLGFSSAEWIAKAPARNAITLVSGDRRHASTLAEPGPLTEESTAFTLTENVQEPPSQGKGHGPH